MLENLYVLFVLMLGIHYKRKNIYLLLFFIFYHELLHHHCILLG